MKQPVRACGVRRLNEGAFEWDTNKEAANLRKHTIGFDEARTVFDDPLANIFDDENHSTEETREILYKPFTAGVFHRTYSKT